MLSTRQLSKAYGEKTLFRGVNFTLTKGERLGLVGRNGYGKTTLLRILCGQEEADNGSVFIPRGYRIATLDQRLQFTEPTITDEVVLGLSDPSERFRAEKMLFGLGFSQDELNRPPAHFSGGYQIRVQLAKLLVSDPDLILLDEPTNYLDVVSMRWLERFLSTWPRELILITHDQTFMDAVCNYTMAIHREGVKKVQGQTEKLYQLIMEEEAVHEKTRQKIQAKQARLEQFIQRFGAKATKASQAKSKAKSLERLPTLAQLAAMEELDFQFRYRPMNNKQVMVVKKLSFSYDTQSKPLIDNFSLDIRPGDRIAIVGKNGRGKSTLLRLLAGELVAREGSLQKAPSVELAYFAQSNTCNLHPTETVMEAIGKGRSDLTEGEIRSIAASMLFSGDDAKKNLSVLSGGETARVLLGQILATPCNLLLLDEPSNHLDMASTEALVEAMETFPGTLLFVSHNELILKRIAEKLIVFKGGSLQLFDGNYQEFLDREGWEENPPDARRKKKEPAVRRQVVKDIERLERKISSMEEENTHDEKEIAYLATKGYSEKLCELSAQIQKRKEVITSLFNNYENLLLQLDQIDSNK